MTFLGILNLQNEDNVRPEEQASVIQVLCKICECILGHLNTYIHLKATCEAVHALTMVLQKNLPYRTSHTAPRANNLDKIPNFMHTELVKLYGISKIFLINLGVYALQKRQKTERTLQFVGG